VTFDEKKCDNDVLQNWMCGAGGFNRDGITDTVRTKVIDVFFKEHSRKPKKPPASQRWV
jgi:hypothetical protein